MIPNSLIPWIDFSNVTFIQFNNSWINTSNTYITVIPSIKRD